MIDTTQSFPVSQWGNVLILFVIVALFFLPAVIQPDCLIYPSYSPHSDLTVIHWPNAHQLQTAYEQFRQIPLWKNVSLSGMPAIANPLAMPYYPLNYLLLRLPINVTFNLLFLLHVFLSGAGLYLFLRLGLRRSAAAALVAAALYMLSGKLIAHVAAGHVSLVAAVAWLPWVLLGINQAIAHRSWMATILTAICLSLQIETHTQVFIYTAYFAALYTAFELWMMARQDGKDGGAWQRSALVVVPIPLLAAALGAVQILPLWELAPYSNRSFSLQQAADYSLTIPQLLLGLFLPSARAGHELTIYPGLVLLGLAVLSLLGPRDRRVIFFAAAAVLGMLVSLGPQGGLFALMYYIAPGWQWMRATARAWLLIDALLAILASYGLDALLNEPDERRLSRLRALIGFFVGAACLLLGGGLIVGYGQWSRAAVALAVLPAAGLSTMWLHRKGKLSPAALAAAALLLGLLDNGSFGRSLVVFKSSAEAFSERATLARDLRNEGKPGTYRTYSPSYSLPQHIAALYELETADGVEPVHLARYDRFMAVAGGYGDDRFSVTIPNFPPDQPLNEALRDTAPDARWLGLLNVQYVIADFPLDAAGLTLANQVGRTYVYRNQLALPRAFAVPAMRPVADGEAAWAALPDLDFRREAVVEGNSADLSGAAQGGGRPDQGLIQAQVVLFSPNKIVVEVNLPGPALLVLSEMWYPGWVAYDNGRPVAVLRADYLLRGVWLGAGHHSVAWVYRPESLNWGLRITSVAGFLSALALVILARRRAARLGAKI